MAETLQWLNLDSLSFPPIEQALIEPNGLLAVGGDLSPERLISAYSNAIFPWFNQGEPPLWWSPSPRAIIFVDNISINRTLRKILRQQHFTVTINTAFNDVLNYCANAPFRKEGTWINNDMKMAYLNLHQLGIAHSIEVWIDEQLVGGLYGVAINGYFSGESMFYIKSNASKIALVYLAQHLKSQNIQFIDCQINNPFLETMGCVDISREKFLHLHNHALKDKISPNFWQARTL